MLTLEGAHFLVSLYHKIREEEHRKLESSSVVSTIRASGKSEEDSSSPSQTEGYRSPWWLHHGTLAVFVLSAPPLGGGYWQTLQWIPCCNFGVEVWTPLWCLYYLPLLGVAGTGKHCMVPCLNTNFC